MQKVEKFAYDDTPFKKIESYDFTDYKLEDILSRSWNSVILNSSVIVHSGVLIRKKFNARSG